MQTKLRYLSSQMKRKAWKDQLTFITGTIGTTVIECCHKTIAAELVDFVVYRIKPCCDLMRWFCPTTVSARNSFNCWWCTERVGSHQLLVKSNFARGGDSGKLTRVYIASGLSGRQFIQGQTDQRVRKQSCGKGRALKIRGKE